MREIVVSSNEANQRFDKLLAKYLKEAPKSFLYKMLRKKNITLNNKKSQGNEILQKGDLIKIFLSDDTYEKFAGKEVQIRPVSLPRKKLDIVYEDDHIILINKPAGMLSQKADPKDISLVEYLISYLLDTGAVTQEMLRSFHPAVCNRLDRNTSGLVIAGKSLTGLQEMSRMIKDRSIQKYYRCIVHGHMTQDQYLKGYLYKDEKSNKVTVFDKEQKDAKPIETAYHVIRSNEAYSLLEVHLITGRSHQIRAHLASTGHSILGEQKYASEALRKEDFRNWKLSSQLLHAYRLVFPEMEGPLSYLSKKEFTAPVPTQFDKII